jgi:hypothetical protein
MLSRELMQSRYISRSMYDSPRSPRDGLLRCARNDAERAVGELCQSLGFAEAETRWVAMGYVVIARSETTKQSKLLARRPMDCFAALAMTQRGRRDPVARNDTERAVGARPIHVIARSVCDEAIQAARSLLHGLLRCARNDAGGPAMRGRVN